jgi:hypothetical protein
MSRNRLRFISHWLRMRWLVLKRLMTRRTRQRHHSRFGLYAAFSTDWSRHSNITFLSFFMLFFLIATSLFVELYICLASRTCDVRSFGDIIVHLDCGVLYISYGFVNLIQNFYGGNLCGLIADTANHLLISS